MKEMFHAVLASVDAPGLFTEVRLHQVVKRSSNEAGLTIRKNTETNSQATGAFIWRVFFPASANSSTYLMLRHCWAMRCAAQRSTSGAAVAPAPAPAEAVVENGTTGLTRQGDCDMLHKHKHWSSAFKGIGGQGVEARAFSRFA